MGELNNKVVVIIGGSSGLGFAAAQLALKAWATVVIVGRSPEKLATAKHKLGDVRTEVADSSDEASIHRLFAGLPQVDHIFLSGGGAVFGKISDLSTERIQQVVQERVWAPIYLVRHAVPKMKGGSITLMSGSLASRPAPGGVIAGTGNAVSEAFVRGLALEIAPVRVNAVAPGWIDTPLVDSVLGPGRDAVLREVAEKLPGKRIGRPEEVAEAVITLMRNEYINGEVLHIDGAGRYV